MNQIPQKPFHWQFSLEESTLIKCGALLLMIIHHSFPWKDRLISDFHYSATFCQFSMSCKLCVAIFAFISGWAFFLSKNKSFTNAVKKSGLFLLYYWICAILCVLFAVFVCDYHIIGKRLLLNEFLPFQHPIIMLHCWYVTYFIILQLTLPLFEQIDRLHNAKLKFSIAIALPLFIGFIPAPNLFPLWNDIRYFLPSGYCGYLFARYHIFDWIHCFISPLNHKLCAVILIVVLCTSMPLYGQCDKLIKLLGQQSLPLCICNGVIAALFIYALVELSRMVHFKPLRSVVIFIGIHSMNIWFLHSLFTSSSTRALFQPYIYYFTTPLFVITACIVTCLPCSIALTLLQNKVKQLYLRVWQHYLQH